MRMKASSNATWGILMPLQRWLLTTSKRKLTDCFFQPYCLQFTTEWPFTMPVRMVSTSQAVSRRFSSERIHKET